METHTRTNSDGEQVPCACRTRQDHGEAATDLAPAGDAIEDVAAERDDAFTGLIPGDASVDA